MEKILKAKDMTLIFFDPYVILHGSIDGNAYDFMEEAEEFVKNFFTQDARLIGEPKENEKDLTRAKHWLVGILYHERKNSTTEIKKLTGYKSNDTVYNIVNKFGPHRSVKEGMEIACQRIYGKSISEVTSESMQRRWDSDKDHTLRDKISKATSEGLTKYWTEMKNNP